MRSSFPKAVNRVVSIAWVEVRLLVQVLRATPAPAAVRPWPLSTAPSRRTRL
jgi:hypothetical protein